MQVYLMSDAQKAAIKRYREKRLAMGYKLVTLELSYKARNRLRELAKSHGSQSRALENILGGD